MTADLDALRAELDAIRDERARLFEQHIAPLDRRAKAVIAHIDAAETVRAEASTDDDLRTDPALLADLFRAGWNLGRGNAAVGERLRTFYNSFAPNAGEGGWGQHIDHERDALLIPLVRDEDVIRTGPAEHADALAPLLRLIPWRTADGTPSRTAEVRTNFGSQGQIEVNLDTDQWALVDTRWGGRTVIASGTGTDVLGALIVLDADN